VYLSSLFIQRPLNVQRDLTLILGPVMAGWLGITWWQAFVADLGIPVFFLVYTVVFTWVFDRVFGLPQSAQVAPPSRV
jgi:uncharacterized membrane protein